jgi:hypothetical protein
MPNNIIENIKVVMICVCMYGMTTVLQECDKKLNMLLDYYNLDK